MAKFVGPNGQRHLRSKRASIWLVRYVHDRDDYICVYCGGPAVEVDHVIPHSRGGLTDESNLVACCRQCNAIAKNQLFATIEIKRIYILEETEARKANALEVGIQGVRSGREGSGRVD